MEKVYAVGFEHDMPTGWKRHFGSGSRIFKSMEDAEKFQSGTSMGIYEFTVNYASEVIKIHTERKEYIWLTAGLD